MKKLIILEILPMGYAFLVVLSITLWFALKAWLKKDKPIDDLPPDETEHSFKEMNQSFRPKPHWWKKRKVDSDG